MSSESNDAYLDKVKDEIRAQAQLLPQRPMLMRQAPPERSPTPAASAIDRDRFDYPIGELTDPHYQAFVENAFCAILKRTPDAAESQTQLALLGAGASKVEILGNLRWSAEGRTIGIHVSGLHLRYLLAKAGRVPVLGYLLQTGLSVAALPLLARHQRAADAWAAAREHAARQVSDALRQRTDDLQALTHELGIARDAQQVLLRDIEAALRSRLEQLEATTSAYAGRFEEIAFLRQRVYAINHWSHHLTGAFARIETVADAQQTEQGVVAARAALEFVAADTQRHARNRAWATEFAAAMSARGRVLSLACGGDWLAMLAAEAFDVGSAEPNAVLRQDAHAQGITIEAAAPLTVLRRTADASLDGLSVLALPVLTRDTPVAEVLADARRALRPRGVLLLAFAREPAALVDVLLGARATTLPADLLAHVVTVAGFIEVSRIDAADCTVALLARKAAS